MDFIQRHKKAFLFTGIAVCITAIILTVNPSIGPTIAEQGLSFVVVPLQRGTTSAVNWIQTRFSAITNSRQLIAENEALRQQNDKLLMDNFILMQAYAENEELSELLNMQQRYTELPRLGARVIAHDPNDWHSSFHIDRGTRDNVTNHMPVMGGGALLGSISQVNPRSARVVTILDHRFSAAVMSSRTGDIGNITGDVALMQQGLTRMNNIGMTAQIMPGDEIVTSPHSMIFPPGLLVGTVVSVHPNPADNGLTRYAIIQPAANLDNVGMVLVITSITEYAEQGYITRDESRVDFTIGD